MKTVEQIREESRPLAEELRWRFREARPNFSIPILLLRMAAGDERLLKELLKFVGVLPQLHSAQDIREHFCTYLGQVQNKPFPLSLAYQSMRAPALYRAVAPMTKWAINNQLAPYFIVKDEAVIEKIVTSYEEEGAGLTVDFLGELVLSDAEADYFFEKYKRAIMRAMYGARHIAIKFSSLYPFFGPENYAESKRRVGEKFEEILRLGIKHGIFVTVDAEHDEFDGLIEDIFCETLMKTEFCETDQVGIAKQVYRIDAFVSAMRLVEFAKRRGTPFMIRLVKGAYKDTEDMLADQKSWSSPILNGKWKTDASFDNILYYLMQNWQYVHVSPATHNPKSIAFAYQSAKEFGLLDDPNFTFQVIYGIGEPHRKVLCAKKMPVLVYTGVAPDGNLEAGMSFIVRRLVENTSNQGILSELISN